MGFGNCHGDLQVRTHCSIPEASTIFFGNCHGDLQVRSLDSSFGGSGTEIPMDAVGKVPHKQSRVDEGIGPYPRLLPASLLATPILKRFQVVKSDAPPVPPKRKAFRAFTGPCMLVSLLCCAQQDTDTNMDLMIPA